VSFCSKPEKAEQTVLSRCNPAGDVWWEIEVNIVPDFWNVEVIKYDFFKKKKHVLILKIKKDFII
jgi:hypothetical protein